MTAKTRKNREMIRYQIMLNIIFIFFHRFCIIFYFLKPLFLWTSWTLDHSFLFLMQETPEHMENNETRYMYDNVCVCTVHMESSCSKRRQSCLAAGLPAG